MSASCIWSHLVTVLKLKRAVPEHAVSIGMGFGALLSKKKGWIDEKSFCDRQLIENFELSLWHDILLDEELIWSAQERIIEKRGVILQLYQRAR